MAAEKPLVCPSTFLKNLIVNRSIPGFNTPGVGFENPHAMLGACHERVQRSLDLLGRLVEHVDRCGHDASSRSAAHDVLRYFSQAAPLHHQDEELHLFPALLSRGSSEHALHVQRLQDDHRQMEALWLSIAPVLQAWTTDTPQPEIAPEARLAITRFRSLYPPHIDLEDSLVFPAAFSLLDPQEIALAGGEMQQRRRVGHNVAAQQKTGE